MGVAGADAAEGQSGPAEAGPGPAQASAVVGVASLPEAARGTEASVSARPLPGSPRGLAEALASGPRSGASVGRAQERAGRPAAGYRPLAAAETRPRRHRSPGQADDRPDLRALATARPQDPTARADDTASMVMHHRSPPGPSARRRDAAHCHNV